MKCPTHPYYQAIYPPRTKCQACELLFALKEFYHQDKKQQKEKTKLMKIVTRKFISPRGKKYTTNNLAKFARRFGLTRTGLSKIVHGHQTHHKNWRVG